jgi:hypothetical protein
VAALKKLVVLGLVVLGAIGGGQMGRNDESAVIYFFLISSRCMTVEAGDAFAGVGAHLKLVNDG